MSIRFVDGRMNYVLLLLSLWLLSLVDSLRLFHATKPTTSPLRQHFGMTPTTAIRRPLYAVDTSIQDVNIDEAIRALFEQQMQELSSSEVRSDKRNLGKTPSKIVPSIKVQKRVVVETPTPVYAETPLEFVSKGKLQFGNFVKPKEDSNAIFVRTASGEDMVIDVTQVISIWDALSDDTIPTTPEDWANIVMEALEIFQRMSPRKTDLEEFWTTVAQRSALIPVDSLDLAVYIFQERKFRVWIDPYSDVEDVGVNSFSAAQRYAAATLLYHDPIYFKRKPSKISWPEDASPTGMHVLDDDLLISSESNKKKASNKRKALPEDMDIAYLPASYILEGGYTALDEGITTFKLCEIFEEYFKANKVVSASNAASTNSVSKSTATSNERSEIFKVACVSRLIRSLELFSLTRGKVPPPKMLKSILKRLNEPLTSVGAKNVLKQLGLGQQHDTGVTAASSDAPAFSPWSAVALQEAKAVEESVSKQRNYINNSPINRGGKRAANGKFDFRATSEQHPVMCLDGKNAAFFDDAFSLNPETGEILIHVTDVVGALKDFPVLKQLAKERVASAFMPMGALHMFPPQALESLKLSKTQSNEVITVALAIDYASGEITSARVFPSIIGPVVPIEVQKADEIIDGVGVKVSDKDGSEYSSKLVYSDAVIRDLRSLDKLVSRMVRKKPWLDITGKTSESKERFEVFVDENGENTGQKQVITDHDGAHRIINTLLTAYATTTYDFCVQNNVPVPLAFENRDKSFFDRPRRFASSPLRNWLSMLQQQQLKAALGMNEGWSRDQCALAVSHYYTKQKEVRRIMQYSRPKSYSSNNEVWKNVATSFINQAL